MATRTAVAAMLRALGASGWIGILAVLAGFAILAWVDPTLALAVLLIVGGAALAVHAAVRAIAARFGMADAI